MFPEMKTFNWKALRFLREWFETMIFRVTMMNSVKPDSVLVNRHKDEIAFLFILWSVMIRSLLSKPMVGSGRPQEPTSPSISSPSRLSISLCGTFVFFSDYLSFSLFSSYFFHVFSHFSLSKWNITIQNKTHNMPFYCLWVCACLVGQANWNDPKVYDCDFA